MNNILIVKTSAIGDVLQTLPILDYLKTRYPEVKIDWAVEKSSYDLLSAHPGLNHVFLADTQGWRKNIFKLATWKAIKNFYAQLRKVKYDLVIDVQGNVKSSLITLFAKAPEKLGFGWKSVSEKPNFFVTNRHYEIPKNLKARSRYLALLQAYFQDHTSAHYAKTQFQLKQEEKERLAEILSKSKRPLLMVAFGSKWKNKQLSEGTLKALLVQINEKHRPYFLFPYGSPDEQRVALELHQQFSENSQALGKLTLPLWQALMGHCDGVLAMDSAALHLCATTHTPTFSLFGPSLASIYQPEGDKHASFQGACPYNKTFIKHCSLLRTCSTGACLREAPVSALFTQFSTWWENLGVR